MHHFEWNVRDSRTTWPTPDEARRSLNRLCPVSLYDEDYGGGTSFFIEGERRNCTAPPGTGGVSNQSRVHATERSMNFCLTKEDLLRSCIATLCQDESEERETPLKKSSARLSMTTEETARILNSISDRRERLTAYWRKTPRRFVCCSFTMLNKDLEAVGNCGNLVTPRYVCPFKPHEIHPQPSISATCSSNEAVEAELESHRCTLFSQLLQERLNTSLNEELQRRPPVSLSLALKADSLGDAIGEGEGYPWLASHSRDAASAVVRWRVDEGPFPVDPQEVEGADKIRLSCRMEVGLIRRQERSWTPSNSGDVPTADPNPERKGTAHGMAPSLCQTSIVDAHLFVLQWAPSHFTLAHESAHLLSRCGTPLSPSLHSANLTHEVKEEKCPPGASEFYDQAHYPTESLPPRQMPDDAVPPRQLRALVRQAEEELLCRVRVADCKWRSIVSMHHLSPAVDVWGADF